MIAQFVKFSLVGLLNTIIHFLVFYLLFSFMGVYHLLASGFGFCFAVVNSFAFNKYWTFNSKSLNIRDEFSRFFIVSLLALLINLATMAILVELFMIRPTFAQLAAIALTIVVNFFGNKFWSFDRC